MAPTADTLRNEEQALKTEIDLLTREKRGGEAEVAAKEEGLREAKVKLGEAKGGYDEEATYQLIKEEMRGSWAKVRQAQLRELQQQIDILTDHISRQREMIEREKRSAQEDRLAVQQIKTRLREQGIAEFQAYTPSEIGSPQRVPQPQASLSMARASEASAEMSQEMLPYQDKNEVLRSSFDRTSQAYVIASSDEDDME